jgi:hypothetical protein
MTCWNYRDGLRSTQGYIRAIMTAGTDGAVVGQGISTDEKKISKKF